MNFGKKIRKFRKNTRAISPVIATLLMIAIAVVASLVTYAWVMGYMNFTTEKTGKAIQIQSVSYPSAGGDTFTIYVQNVGDSAVQFPVNSPGQSVFINGVQANPITINGATTATTVDQGSTATIVATYPSTATALSHTVQSVTFKVTTLDGTFAQVTQQFTIK
jgi:archaeal type IV pilus assembly protein PilA